MKRRPGPPVRSSRLVRVQDWWAFDLDDTGLHPSTSNRQRI
jgi:hypothetical protein